MCRNIKPLFNVEPPVTEEEIRAAARQFVRKISGFSRPSKVNEAAFCEAVGEVASACKKLLDSLRTDAAPRHRTGEAGKADARAAKRFAT